MSREATSPSLDRFAELSEAFLADPGGAPVSRNHHVFAEGCHFYIADTVKGRKICLMENKMLLSKVTQRFRLFRQPESRLFRARRFGVVFL